MPLSPDDYAKYGIQDYHDVQERGVDSPWEPGQTWEMDGVTVTEEQFNEAWAHFEKTGERPDWWTNRSGKE